MNSLINNKKRIKALAICTGFFSLAACKESSISKSTMVPDVDNIHTFAMNADSFNINFKNSLSDSFLTSNYYIPDSVGNNQKIIVIGAYSDNFFGKTSASGYFQVTPPSANYKFPENTTLDSAVLVLPYTYSTYKGMSYGDTASNLNVKVFRTTEKIDFSKSYFSSSTVPLESTPIATASIPYSAYGTYSRQALAATKDTTYGQLRIKLSNSFASELKNADTNFLASTTAFQNFLKGLAVVPDPDAPSNLMSYFTLPAPNNNDLKNLSAARIEMHYHNSQDSAMMSSFTMKPSVSGYFTHFRRNYSGYQSNNYINKESDSILAQSIPGFRTDITINNLDRIPVAVINKAEIVITAINIGNTALFKAPEMLYPTFLLDDGSEQQLHELFDNRGNVNGPGTVFVDPYVRYVTIGGVKHAQYRLNIPRTLQRVINEGKNKITIRLTGSQRYPAFGQLLASGLNGENKFQFNIIYTKK